MTLDAVDLNIYLFFLLSFCSCKSVLSVDALTTVSLLNGCAREKLSSTLAPVPESYTIMSGLSSLSIY